MHPFIQLKMTTLAPLLRLLFICFALCPMAHAVIPAPDGGYPGANTAEGTNALFSLTAGAFNTALGWLTLQSNTQANYNTAIGAGALFSNTITEQNTATGAGALFTNIGAHNTATGAFALFKNTNGSGNTAVGSNALYNNTTAQGNTATGFRALLNNTTGPDNTSMGGEALMFNTSGQGNTATGRSALHNNTTGSFNTASGSFALPNHTVGDSNTAVGAGTLFDNQSGIANTAVGRTALAGLLMGDNNTAVGDSAGINNTSGNNNVYIGQGMVGINGENNACYIKSIFGQTAPDSVPVYITSNNKLGTVVSSKRFKEDIKPMDKASEVILSLKPVAFRYKKEIDRTGTSQFGLLAEEVEKVNPNLVVRDKDGKPYSVRYDQVNAMLLNEFLKEHQTVQELKKQVAELTAGLQKVSAQLAATSPSNGGLDLTEPGPAVAINNR